MFICGKILVGGNRRVRMDKIVIKIPNVPSVKTLIDITGGIHLMSASTGINVNKRQLLKSFAFLHSNSF